MTDPYERRFHYQIIEHVENLHCMNKLWGSLYVEMLELRSLPWLEQRARRSRARTTFNNARESETPACRHVLEPRYAGGSLCSHADARAAEIIGIRACERARPFSNCLLHLLTLSSTTTNHLHLLHKNQL